MAKQVNTIWVQLLDKGSIFMDTYQGNQAVTGERCVELKKTNRVVSAIAKQVIKEVTAAKAKEINAALDNEVTVKVQSQNAKEAKLRKDVATSKKALEEAEKRNKEYLARIAELEEAAKKGK